MTTSRETIQPGAAKGATRVHEVMVTGVVAAHEDAVFKEIADALVRNGISAVPVVDAQHRVIGVVSGSDLLARASAGRVALPVGPHLASHAEMHEKTIGLTARELMTSPPVVTTPDTDIMDAARHAARARVHRLPVVDPEGVLVGLVAREDLLRPFLRSDAAIRDDIASNVIVAGLLLDEQDVDVVVVEGVVTLRGELDRRAVRDLLVDLVHAVVGVVEVDATMLTVRENGD